MQISQQYEFNNDQGMFQLNFCTNLKTHILIGVMLLIIIFTGIYALHQVVYISPNLDGNDV